MANIIDMRDLFMIAWRSVRLAKRVSANSFQKLLGLLISTNVYLVNRTNRTTVFGYSIYIFGFPVYKKRMRRKGVRVGLLVDEFFGGWDTAVGGYGALARKYICRFVPNDDIQIDVLLDPYSQRGVKSKVVDGTVLYRLPKSRHERNRWLDRQCYDLFLSIEMTAPSFEIVGQYQRKVPLLYWIQDPRDLTMYQARLKTVSRLRDGDWGYIRQVTPWIGNAVSSGMIRFISQGESL